MTSKNQEFFIYLQYLCSRKKRVMQQPFFEVILPDILNLKNTVCFALLHYHVYFEILVPLGEK